MPIHTVCAVRILFVFVCVLILHCQSKNVLKFNYGLFVVYCVLVFVCLGDKGSVLAPWRQGV